MKLNFEQFLDKLENTIFDNNTRKNVGNHALLFGQGPIQYKNDAIRAYVMYQGAAAATKPQV